MTARSALAAATWVALAWISLGYVLPADRVLEELSRKRADQKPIHLVASLVGLGESWPARVWIDLHPLFGLRVRDSDGGRWVLSRGRMLGSNQPRLY